MIARLTLRTATVALGVGVLAICLPWSSAQAAPKPAYALLSAPLLTVPLPLPSLDPILKTVPLPVTVPPVDPLLKALLNLTPILAPLAPPTPPGGGTTVPVPGVVPPTTVVPPGAPPAGTAKAPAAAANAANGQQTPPSSTRGIGAAGPVGHVTVRAKAPVRPGLFATGSGAARGLVIPLLLVVVLAGFLGAQRLIDRRDPKLAQSPAWPEPDLRFG